MEKVSNLGSEYGKPRINFSINDKRIREFSSLLGNGMSREEIQKEMGIRKSTYYKYHKAIDIITENYMVSLVSHGIILQFKELFDRIKKRQKLYDKAIDVAAKNVDKDPLILIRCLKSADDNDVAANSFLDDGKLVSETMKTLKKVFLDNALNRK